MDEGIVLLEQLIALDATELRAELLGQLPRGGRRARLVRARWRAR
jgi:hypothetical protein